MATNFLSLGMLTDMNAVAANIITNDYRTNTIYMLYILI